MKDWTDKIVDIKKHCMLIRGTLGILNLRSFLFIKVLKLGSIFTSLKIPWVTALYHIGGCTRFKPFINLSKVFESLI